MSRFGLGVTSAVEKQYSSDAVYQLLWGLIQAGTHDQWKKGRVVAPEKLARQIQSFVDADIDPQNVTFSHSHFCIGSRRAGCVGSITAPARRPSNQGVARLKRVLSHVSDVSEAARGKLWRPEWRRSRVFRQGSGLMVEEVAKVTRPVVEAAAKVRSLAAEAVARRWHNDVSLGRSVGFLWRRCGGSCDVGSARVTLSFSVSA